MNKIIYPEALGLLSFETTQKLSKATTKKQRDEILRLANKRAAADRKHAGSLGRLVTHRDLLWDEAVKKSAEFLPEARRISKRETGKACNNFSTQLILAKFFVHLKENE